MEENHNNNRENKELREISRHFEKMSNAIHHFTEVYKENTHRLPFWKTKSFWSLVVVVSSLAVGFLSLYYTSRDAFSLVKAYNIQQKINRIQDFKAAENKAIDKARILVLNQIIHCPVSNINKLKAMKVERNKSLVDVVSYDSGLDITQDELIEPFRRQIVSKIYSIKIHGICRINPRSFDRETLAIVRKFNETVNRILLKQQYQLDRLSF